MERDKEFDELLRRKISDTLGEQIDDSIDADDLMFDLGMRYLRLMAAEKKKTDSKKAHQLSLWSDNAASKKALIDYLQDKGFTIYICSGSDELVVRVIVEGGLVLASRHVIGTKELIIAKHQGEKAGSDYVFRQQPHFLSAVMMRSGRAEAQKRHRRSMTFVLTMDGSRSQ